MTTDAPNCQRAIADFEPRKRSTGSVFTTFRSYRIRTRLILIGTRFREFEPIGFIETVV